MNNSIFCMAKAWRGTSMTRAWSLMMILATVMTVTSCRSSKKATDATVDETTKKVETLPAEQKKTESKKTESKATEKKTKKWAYGTNYTAKVSVKVKVGDKDISTNGSLKMRKDDVIQITLVDPVLGVMEVGRMEISPDSVLVIDRVNKRYMQESYETLSLMAGKNITFDAVQQLFWDEANKAGNSGTITYTIPLKTPVTLSLKQSRIGSDSDWNAHTKVSAKYERMSALALFKSMVSAEE